MVMEMINQSLQNWPKIQPVRKNVILRTGFLRIYGIVCYNILKNELFEEKIRTYGK